MFALRLCLIAALLALTHQASATDAEEDNVQTGGKCYQVSNLTLETKVLRMRDWLVSYGAKAKVSAEILFNLYIPPQLTEQDAELIVRWLKFFDKLEDAKVIRKGILHKGVDLGNFNKADLEPLVAFLLGSGYAPAMQPLYNASQLPVVHALEGAEPLNVAAFAREFPGYRLTPFANCDSL